MKRAAIGIRAHSGWGALVAVSGNPAAPEVIDRRRIEIIDPHIQGAQQPYHFAQEQTPAQAERYLTDCAAVSERLAMAAVREAVAALQRREYDVAGCAILLGSGRSLPPLSKILASHALIHTAEGVFFREAFSKACERLKIPVMGVIERELDASERTRIAALGRSLGPPWTTDQKAAAQAALLVLTHAKPK